MEILGYHAISDEDVALINRIKLVEVAVQNLVNDIDQAIAAANAEHGIGTAEPYRWLELGKSDIQVGLMALTRAVARPNAVY